jgi:hypothetical protein
VTVDGFHAWTYPNYIEIVRMEPPMEEMSLVGAFKKTMLLVRKRRM